MVSKEHIDAASPSNETPATQSVTTPEAEIRRMRDDEITVDGCGMKPNVRGTSHDPRALQDEQWLIKVRILHNGRTIQVHADQAQWGNCTRRIISKSGIAQASTPEPFGPPRLSES